MRSSVLLALVALLFAAPAAQACTDQPLSKPFTPWLDVANYEPAPDLGVEDGAGAWTLNGASVASGGHPWNGGDRSLRIPAGTNAVTGPVCITMLHPTLRFFARPSTLLGVLTVSVIAGPLELPVGVVAGLGTAWSPSPILPILVNLLGDQDVRFRFTSTLGSFRIDDVWIDPYSKG